jgi:HEAT repeat protein
VAWFSFRTKVPQLHLIEKEIKESPATFSTELKNKLQLFNFEEKWALTKRLLRSFDDKTKSRNFVRCLFAEQTEKIIDLLGKREDMAVVVECLSYFPSREVVQILVGLLNDKHEEIQLIAAAALMNHTPRLVVPAVMEKFLKTEVPVSRAGEVLLGMDYLAQDALLDAYEQAKEDVQAQILELLAISRNPKCKHFLASALLSENTNLKKAALQAVSTLKCRDLWEEVALNLSDPTWQIRTKAMDVLTKIDAGEALEMVVPFVNDEDPWVRKEAKAFVQRWGQKSEKKEGKRPYMQEVMIKKDE